MSILQRAFDAARRVTTPAPRMVAPTPTPATRITGQIPAGGFALGGTQPTFLTAPPPTALQRAIAPVQTLWGDFQQGREVEGGVLGVGGVFDVIPRTLAGPVGTPGAVEQREVPAPSQPASAIPETRRVTSVPPAPTLPPTQPALAPGAFQAQAPATRAPIVTPATAPTPAMTPPAPFMMGGGGDRGAIIGGGINVPTETPLPPARVLPADLGTEAPMGQFDAMIRALQAGQGVPSRYVPMPAAGATPFGPAGAQERALRRLRERELMPV